MQSIGSKILEAAKAANKSHPRIILTAEDFARLRDNKDKGLTKCLVDAVLKQADSILDQPPRIYEIPDGVRLLHTSRAIEYRVMYLSYAYQITGEEKYAARAAKEIEAACAFPDFHPRHFLDCAELCIALAFAYDWLYDYLSEELKASIRENLIHKGFERVMEEYTNAPEHKDCLEPQRGYRWYQDKPGDNWKMVCNGSLTLAVLAIFDEIECDLCEPILTHAFEDTYEAVRTFYDAEDGTYSEGPGYWEYATVFLGYYSKGMISATGSDVGLVDAPGVRLSPYSILSLASPDKVSFNFGDAGTGSVTCPVFNWCAERFGDLALYSVRRPDIENGHANYDDVLFFRDVESMPLSTLPLALGRNGGDNAAFRTDVGEGAFYAAIHLAKNNAYHGHNDMGTFIMNIGSKRFFVDLGADNYNLRPYRDAYRFRAEGHNTIVINPETGKDNEMKANCFISRFSDGEESLAIGDMSEAFPGKRVVRGMMMRRADGSVILQDEIECAAEDTVRWSAHTPASVIFRDQGKTAILDMDGTKMCVRLLSDGYFTVRAAAPDAYSPIPAPAEHADGLHPQAKNEGKQKLVVNLSGREKHTVAVWFYPLTDGREIPTEDPNVKPLAEW